MSRRCSNTHCFAHEGESCAQGHPKPDLCPSWSKEQPPAEQPVPTAPNNARLPWSGSALGLDDLSQLLPRGRSIVIGVLGAHDAGKTTLLAGNYLQLLAGQSLAGASFAGSRTLGAWESLAAWTRFDDAARSPSFPPHTPRGISRVPGLLHLALRRPNHEHRDLLFTDAPGEWFSAWATKEDAPNAEGARWIQERADAFLVFADCERLCGGERGDARRDIRELIERLGKHVRQRPTTLVWSKADHQPPQGIRGAIQRALKENIEHASEIETSVLRPNELGKALEAVLYPAWTPRFAQALIESPLHQQPFAAFRGIYARS